MERMDHDFKYMSGGTVCAIVYPHRKPDIRAVRRKLDAYTFFSKRYVSIY